MQRALEAHSVGQTLTGLRFMNIRLLSRPASKPMAGEAKAAHDVLFAADQAYIAARDAVIASTAEVEYLDAELDTSVIQAGREARPLVNGQIDHPDWLLAFPVSPSEGTKSVGGNAQAHYVRNVIDRFRTRPTFAPLQARAQDIEDKLAALTAAEAEREALRAVADRAKQERAVIQRQVIKLYNLMYPRLQILFEEQARLVESFFYVFKSAGGPTEGEEESEG